MCLKRVRSKTTNYGQGWMKSGARLDAISRFPFPVSPFPFPVSPFPPLYPTRRRRRRTTGGGLGVLSLGWDGWGGIQEFPGALQLLKRRGHEAQCSFGIV